MPVRHAQSKPKVIAIVGPTASGKTALGIYLAKKLHGEIISADSRQIYRGMDIIAGTPSKKEQSGIIHHMLAIADPKRQMSAGEFSKKGRVLLSSLAVPIVVGGTGFYVESLLGTMSLPEVAPNLKLRKQLEKKTAAQLFTQLKKIDPRRAKEIDPFNKVRLIRAIEIAKVLGKVPNLPSTSPFEILWLGLNPQEKILRKNIHTRIHTRIKKGMSKEAATLRKLLSKKRYNALGAEFQLLGNYLDKKISKQELLQSLETWELKYAVRQMRWHRRNKQIHWIQNQSEALSRARTFLR